MMTKVFMYGFEADEFVEKLIDNGQYSVEVKKEGNLYVVTW